MLIGTFFYDRPSGTYHGELVMLAFEQPGVSITWLPNPPAQGPHYEVWYEGLADGIVVCGHAWRRDDCLEVTLDDPMFPKPVQAKLFPCLDRRFHVLEWERRPWPF